MELDPLANNNILSSLYFGPLMWKFFHGIAACYPLQPSADQQENMQTLITSGCKAIPCFVCKMHATHYIQTHPIQTSSRTELFQYIVEFHNHVNQKLQYKHMTFDEAARMISNNANEAVKLKSTITSISKDSSNNNTTFNIIASVGSVVVLILIVVAVYFSRNKKSPHITPSV